MLLSLIDPFGNVGKFAVQTVAFEQLHDVVHPRRVFDVHRSAPVHCLQGKCMLIQYPCRVAAIIHPKTEDGETSM